MRLCNLWNFWNDVSKRWWTLNFFSPLGISLLQQDSILSTPKWWVCIKDLEDSQMVSFLSKPWGFPNGDFFKPLFVMQVQEAGYKGDRPTKIIVHGFLDTGQEVWVKVGGAPFWLLNLLSLSRTWQIYFHFLGQDKSTFTNLLSFSRTWQIYFHFLGHDKSTFTF